MQAIRLRTDYLKEPLGLGNPSPRFYWNCEGGLKQTAYQIICKRDGVTVWDSGKVLSTSMTHIAYEGKTLCSRDRVTWSVQLWDEKDVSGEAAESWFEMGLLEKSDWKASWVTGNYKPNKKTRYPVDCFKKEFHTQKKVTRARLYASARGVYEDGRLSKKHPEQSERCQLLRSCCFTPTVGVFPYGKLSVEEIMDLLE